MANKKLKLLYLADYLRHETDEQHPKTVADIIAHLASHGISAERKSVYDDIHLLQDYGMDVQTVKAKNYGYFLGERPFELPELKLLIDTVQSSPFLTKKKSLALIEKLESFTSRPMARQLRGQVFVMNRVRTMNERVYYAVDGINTAICTNCKISFRYFDWTVDGAKAYRHDGELYTVNPVALCVDRQYYLVAYDTALADYRHYRVDRMENLTVLSDARDPMPEGFDLGSYVKSLFDMFNGETQMVRLAMDNSLLNVAIDRFGADAHKHALSPDRFELTAPVEVGPTFYGWLFQFGTQAQILSPNSVRDDFAAYCRETLAQYE